MRELYFLRPRRLISELTGQAITDSATTFLGQMNGLRIRGARRRDGPRCAEDRRADGFGLGRVGRCSVQSSPHRIPAMGPWFRAHLGGPMVAFIRKTHGCWGRAALAFVCFVISVSESRGPRLSSFLTSLLISRAVPNCTDPRTPPCVICCVTNSLCSSPSIPLTDP